MKKYSFILLLLGIALSSCSSYQYTARQTNVQRRDINTSEKMAGIDVDYTRQVIATSDFQLTRQSAIQEAEYICIQQSKVDVIVDPIVKIEYNPIRLKKRYKATITGYAGMYKNEPTTLEKSKDYTLEEIEKYKLLTDPTFPQYYYNNGTQGDQYYFGTKGFGSEKTSSSLMIQPTGLKNLGTPKVYDYQQSLKLRNTGIGLLSSGAVMMFVVGIPCLMSAPGAGAAFMAIGGAAITAGVPLITIGAIRTKKAQNMNITMNSSSNGIGLGLTF
jgi:hypothetical protein